MSEANGFVTADAFRQPTKRRYSTVDVEGFGKVRIRSLTELERSRYEASALDKSGRPSLAKLVDMKCRLLVLCIVDADGNQLLSNSDIVTLQQYDSRITNQLADAIREHCGISAADSEDLEKNCETTGGVASP